MQQFGVNPSMHVIPDGDHYFIRNHSFVGQVRRSTVTSLALGARSRHGGKKVPESRSQDTVVKCLGRFSLEVGGQPVER